MKPKTWKEKCDIHIKTWVHSTILFKLADEILKKDD